MAKFGRFAFGEDEPRETYEGGHMKLEKGYVKILRAEPSIFDLQTEDLVAVIHLDKGQSMREIRTD
jgi:hypothetical protein